MTDGDPPVEGPLFPGRRECSRLRVRLPARLVTLRGEQAVVLADLSETGARVRLGAEAPALGAEALLQWNGQEAFGCVQWTHEGFCGLHFFDPLNPGIVLATRALDSTGRLPDETTLLRDAARRWVEGTIGGG